MSSDIATVGPDLSSLYEAADVMLTSYKARLAIRDRQTIDDALGVDRARPSSLHHHACHAATWHRVQIRVAEQH